MPLLYLTSSQETNQQFKFLKHQAANLWHLVLDMCACARVCECTCVCVCVCACVCVCVCVTCAGCMVVGLCEALAAFSASCSILPSTISAMSCRSSAWCSPTRAIEEPTTWGEGGGVTTVISPYNDSTVFRFHHNYRVLSLGFRFGVLY